MSFKREAALEQKSRQQSYLKQLCLDLCVAMKFQNISSA